ncbi:MAG: hypothetical protein IOC39_00915 [Burkholderia sp.]|jgi:hypothetical protein|uniref:hypothetical protein n=1 Tax=Burkholderia sp. TaxID=36773 RepID=UPI0025887417|nr:hypothetical protein [Burkholderia sp.]MCA3781410.1 hypothetical protein [Burkholderia sp.]MCA3787162.1 hypothetical protein [Burkholderia sp.]MCA3795502.1 hypothetical protein [Burkholderia sp.]MCA3802252.1 hypothetical protein [Burkholderia sp.]MCA3808410.1 hypothetical protein [Burkholderia sp.]
MNLIRLNGAQCAVMERVEINGHSFVQFDLHAQQPDADALVRMLISTDKITALANALLAARDDVEPARLERSNG